MMRLWSRRRRALVCRDAVALMTAYLDGELSAKDRARLEGHLADCPHCSEYLAQLRVTIDALGRVDVEDLSDDAVDDLVELYRRWRAG
jgi:anti-sigma factor RsiW